MGQMKVILVATAYIISKFRFNHSPSNLDSTFSVSNSLRFKISASGSQNSLMKETSTGIQASESSSSRFFSIFSYNNAYFNLPLPPCCKPVHLIFELKIIIFQKSSEVEITFDDKSGTFDDTLGWNEMFESWPDLWLVAHLSSEQQRMHLKSRWTLCRLSSGCPWCQCPRSPQFGSRLEDQTWSSPEEYW